MLPLELCFCSSNPATPCESCRRIFASAVAKQDCQLFAAATYRGGAGFRAPALFRMRGGGKGGKSKGAWCAGMQRKISHAENSQGRDKGSCGCHAERGRVDETAFPRGMMTHIPLLPRMAVVHWCRLFMGFVRGVVSQHSDLGDGPRCWAGESHLQGEDALEGRVAVMDLGRFHENPVKRANHTPLRRHGLRLD
jgi:hypothetical protein